MAANMNIRLVLLGGVILLGTVIGSFKFLMPHSAPSDAPPQDGAITGFHPLAAPLTVPAGDFIDEVGKAADLSRFKGKVTLVNLWATWCQPCIREMPSLERLKAAREGAHFTVATISEDIKGGLVVEPFFAKSGLSSLPRYIDPKNTLLRAFGVEGLPTTLLLDSEGREIARFEGAAEWDGPDAMRLLDWYIEHAG
ncbi:MAG: TlpA disulfide reductase family protein [Aliidongia sp.]